MYICQVAKHVLRTILKTIGRISAKLTKSFIHTAIQFSLKKVYLIVRVSLV